MESSKVNLSLKDEFGSEFDSFTFIPRSIGDGEAYIKAGKKMFQVSFFIVHTQMKDIILLLDYKEEQTKNIFPSSSFR